MIEPGHAELSVVRQCQLLGVARSSYYYRPTGESVENLRLMRLLDEIYTECPYYGSRRMAEELKRRGERVNRKRMQRLMRLMGLEAMYPRPKTTQRNPEHRVYPYLLRDVKVERCDQVWSTDITYIPMARGFMYLMAIMDWHSRYVLTWQLSNTLDAEFCVEALDRVLVQGQPEIFNTDQGVQFTSLAFTRRLEEAEVAISMDGRGRALDNVFIERLWRTVKYEDIYLKDYADVRELEHGLRRYFDFYNHQRPHQALNYQTPATLYQAG